MTATHDRPGNERVDQFRSEVADADLGIPETGRDRMLLLAGVVVGLVGVGLIIGGWVGASGEVTVAAQIPYVISGGCLGLALVVAGAALYVRGSMSRYLRFWLVRQIYEQRAQAQQIADALKGRDAAP